MENSLPVTVLVSSSESVRTHALEQLLNGAEAARVTAIIPSGEQLRFSDRPELSIRPTIEEELRLGQGCGCCTVRGDLLSKIKEIAAERGADHIVIQSAPGDDLTMLAKTFTVADSRGATLSDVAQLENMVTVVNAELVLNLTESTAARPLIEQIEFANVILIESEPELGVDQQQRVTDTLQLLNPDANLVWASRGQLTLSHLQSEHSFDLNAAQMRSKRPVNATSDHSSEQSVRFVYHERRPFHPERLAAFLEGPLEGVLRLTGSFWVASRPDYSAVLDLAGSDIQTSVNGKWWAGVSVHQRPKGKRFQEYIKSVWHPKFGDRRQELIVSGLGIDEIELRDQLERCLLTKEELAKPKRWAKLSHPFPWP